jgi:hypothetical protein
MKAKHAVIAAAVVASWSAAPVFGQTAASNAARAPVAVDARANDTPEERASAVIRVIDAPTTSTQAAPVTTAELVRSRAAGEMLAPEPSQPIQVERIHIDDPARSAARSPAGVVIQRGGDGRPQIVRAAPDAKDRSKPQAVVRLDDAARYRETARYETEKKRRESARAAAPVETAQPRTTESPVTVMGSARGRAEIAWSPPERLAPPAVVVESPEG